ncbi:MAG: glutamate racemase [Bacteroidetes bacterium GWF2_33_16]|nr:MAG: glutamate racemase [Bacteroidetes bacterium GWE2_32_14]OFY08837.1 MAG: glutamate racemase [Bacteroidetes bacterium GWF2_33_16]
MGNRPIGIFDSGVGGLTVWREFVKALPKEDVIYYADSVNCPYGPKSQQEIIKIVDEVVQFLLAKNVKMIIVACNTATAAAIDYLRFTYPIPFIGMEPAVKPAALNSKTKSIAVLATEGTFNGKLYLETKNKFASDVEVHIKVGDKLVDIVENNKIYNPETALHIEELMAPLIKRNIDHLVLGCTHYPFLLEILQQVLPPEVKIIDPAPAVIKQAAKVLTENKLLRTENEKPEYEFYSSGNSEILKSFVFKITKINYKIQTA